MLVDRLAGQLHVLELQQATLQALQEAAAEGSLTDLQDELQPLAVLYNEYAAKHKVGCGGGFERPRVHVQTTLDGDEGFAATYLMYVRRGQSPI